jgi:anti-sigma regulatory factor (Ser/Thr protein kinase)
MRRTRSFSREPESVGAARRFASDALTGTSSEALDAVALMVSELATNCFRHTDAAFEVSVVHAHEQIRVEVTDGAGGTPVMGSPRPDDLTGRGLRIVNLLSEAWGVKYLPAGGKTVWFEITDPTAAPQTACAVGGSSG